ncbi:MAG: glycine cleavage system aminomethyltransferase GcvT [Bacteroidia bacterium]|nr:glycine cleavage system aminomethyltransferase GcvT [Bacteroidia bacterium]
MKDTPLSKIHIEMGAKMASFAGYNMPIQYEGIKAEHEAVRKGLGIFDVSHMGEFIVRGPGSLELIQLVSSNDASKLSPGRVQYSCLPNDKGGIVDDLLVYMLDENSYMLVVNASNIEKDWNWIMKHNKHNVEMINISDETSLLAVQGPKAAEALQKFCDVDLSELKYYHFVKTSFAGIDNVIISATGYTGAGGFELYFENKDAVKVWHEIINAGEKYGIKAAGLGARDTLRLEMGFCLYGNDIDDHTSPLEAGLGWITKFTKEFINSENLKTQKENGIKKRLIGFEMLGRGIPRKDYKILNSDKQEVGIVTSGSHSPSLNKAIGMGYVNVDHKSEGTKLFISIRDKEIEAEVVKLPFYQSN